MRLAAIDVGTNSIHTVIVEVGEDLSIRIIDSAKDTVHLGRGRDAKGNLTARAMTDALASLRKSQLLIDSHGVEKTLAVATSAIREAPNGLEFLRLVAHKTGVEVRVITGVEEARLIYLAVRESVHLDNKPFLAIDIGGGSVEFIWGTRERLAYGDSVKAGVLRLAEEVPLSDPPTKDEIARLRETIEDRLSKMDEPNAQHPKERVVGTSGTIHQLCRLAVTETPLRANRSLHQQVVRGEDIRKVCDHLIRSTVQERMDMKALDRTRVHTIVPGAVLIQAAMDRFGVNDLIVCEYALREGVIYDYVEKNRAGLRHEQQMTDVRRRSVLALARKCGWDEPHCRHIARLSLQMFDQLAEPFGWEPWERDILEFASYLHDIGMLISVPNHHRHSQYLIENSELLGFTPSEIAVMGNAVRYHRRAKPKKKHETYRALTKKERTVVDRLAGILKIAEALDRTRFQLIESVHIETTEFVRMTALAVGDAEVELSLANERTDLLERSLRKKIVIRRSDAELPAEIPSSVRVSFDDEEDEDDEESFALAGAEESE